MVSPPHPTLLTSSSFPTERTHELHFGTFQFRETNSHIRVVRLEVNAGRGGARAERRKERRGTFLGRSVVMPLKMPEIYNISNHINLRHHHPSVSQVGSIQGEREARSPYSFLINIDGRG